MQHYHSIIFSQGLGSENKTKRMIKNINLLLRILTSGYYTRDRVGEITVRIFLSMFSCSLSLSGHLERWRVSSAQPDFGWPNWTGGTFQNKKAWFIEDLTSPERVKRGVKNEFHNAKQYLSLTYSASGWILFKIFISVSK